MSEKIIELSADELHPPMALDVFIERMGISRKTAWSWRKSGALQTVNIYGRVYVPAKEIVNFNRRAALGEFEKQHIAPRPKTNAVRPQSSPARRKAGTGLRDRV